MLSEIDLKLRKRFLEEIEESVEHRNEIDPDDVRILLDLLAELKREGSSSALVQAADMLGRAISNGWLTSDGLPPLGSPESLVLTMGASVTLEQARQECARIWLNLPLASRAVEVDNG